MSLIALATNGKDTGRVVDEFTAKQMELDLTSVPKKAIYIKLTPDTDLFNKVVLCADHLEVTPTKAARILMRAGWLGYIKSKLMELRSKGL